MAGNDSKEELIPTLTWATLPYRVQILDNMVLLFNVKNREQYVQVAHENDIQRLRILKSARLVTGVLRAIFGKSLITDPLTPNERKALNVFDRVYTETGDIQKADDAYIVTMEFLQ